MSNPTRNGKIARLPKPIREEINQRLANGATAHSLLDWLNSLPEVQAVVQSEFDGHPVSDQNLSQWRKGGYEDWLRHQEALEVVQLLYEQGEELKAQGKNRLPVNEVLSLWLSSRFVAATREIPTLDPEAAWRKQRQLCDDLMKMRRAEYRTEHLQIERDRVELQRAEVQLERERFESDKGLKTRAEARQEKSPRRKPAHGNRDDFESEENDEPLTAEEKKARWKAALGIPYAPPLPK